MSKKQDIARARNLAKGRLISINRNLAKFASNDYLSHAEEEQIDIALNAISNLIHDTYIIDIDQKIVPNYWDSYTKKILDSCNKE